MVKVEQSIATSEYSFILAFLFKGNLVVFVKTDNNVVVYSIEKDYCYRVIEFEHPYDIGRFRLKDDTIIYSTIIRNELLYNYIDITLHSNLFQVYSTVKERVRGLTYASVPEVPDYELGNHDRVNGVVIKYGEYIISNFIVRFKKNKLTIFNNIN